MCYDGAVLLIDDAAAFHRYDKNGDGGITVEEMRLE